MSFIDLLQRVETASLAPSWGDTSQARILEADSFDDLPVEDQRLIMQCEIEVLSGTGSVIIDWGRLPPFYDGWTDATVDELADQLAELAEPESKSIDDDGDDWVGVG